MPKIPRDISGRELAKLLNRYKYKIVRETGSHIRLVSTLKQTEHRITIPDHQPTKIGTETFEKHPFSVIPAKARIYKLMKTPDSRPRSGRGQALRGNDKDCNFQ
jgi:predicted RNA binding protein YcfA (HicA-like mRNA interferase family)